MIYYLNENTEQFDIYDHINSLYEIAYDCQIEMLNINEDAESVKRTVSYYIDRIIQKIKDFFRMIRNKIQEWMRKYSISKLERDIKSGKIQIKDIDDDIKKPDELIKMIKDRAMDIAEGKVESVENVL